MKTAFLFSGFTRGFQHGFESMREHVFNNFGECHYYFYITDDSDSDWRYSSSLENLKSNFSSVVWPSKYFGITSFSLRNCEIIQNLAKNEPTYVQFGEPLTANPDNDTQYNNINHCNQWNNVLQVKEMMVRRGIEYDYVCRIRPDLFFLKPVLPSLIQDNSVMVPALGGWGGINDKFAIGKMEPMIYYLDYYLSDEYLLTPEKLPPELRGRKLNPEFKLAQRMANSPYSAVPSNDISARIINPDGSLRDH